MLRSSVLAVPDIGLNMHTLFRAACLAINGCCKLVRRLPAQLAGPLCMDPALALVLDAGFLMKRSDAHGAAAGLRVLLVECSCQLVAAANIH